MTPESWMNMLSEFGNQDSTQVLDSMYYKIVGMLIAIAHIMVSKLINMC